MVRSREQNAGKNYNIKIYNKSFERDEEFKYLGTTLKDQNSIQEEIKSRLNAIMLSTIRCRISCLPVSYPKKQRL